ncbi:MAG TPA: hypothetical protein VMG10_00225 [Gemmataceae bacterium]|nr:hypothetical protein [Gemmataceae bacterium]
MLRFTARWMGLSVRGFSLAMLLVLSIAIPNLSPRRGFAGDERSQSPTREAVKPKKAKAERPPFDLTYVPPYATGVIAVRPNAIFRDPAMKPLACMANQSPLVGMMLLPYIPFADLKLPVQEIEQVVLYTMATPDTKNASGFGFATVMIRTTHDFDWLKQMQHIDPETKQLHWGNQVYYRSHQKLGKKGIFSDLTISPKATFLYIIPDKRSLVLIPSPSVLRAFRAAETTRSLHFSWDKEWKHVEKCLIAWAADNRSGRAVSSNQFGDGPFPEWSMLTRKTTTMVAGLDWKDGIDLRAYLTGKDQSVRDQIVRDIKAMLANWPRDLDEASQELPEDKDLSKQARQEAAFELQLYNDLYKHASVTRRENTVCVHTMARLSISDLAKHFLCQWEGPVQGKKP